MHTLRLVVVLGVLSNTGLAQAQARTPALVAPVTRPTPPVPEPSPALAERPNRARRPFAIGGEIGWNGLAGLGLGFSYHPIPYLAIDAGAGLSAAGWKGGLRLRANLLTSAWTPVIGAGFLYAVGSGGTAVNVETQGDSARVEILGSPYAQLIAGVNYTGDQGFMFMATTGYAILLRDNTRFVSGSPGVHDDVRALVGSGLVASAAIGYAF
jgi:hypothetical protein